MEVKSFFEILKIVMEKKPFPSDEIINKHTNQWMINNYLSCEMNLIYIAAELSRLTLTNKQYFEFLYYGLPKMKKFIQYNAKKPKKEEDIKMISEWFKVSISVAENYIDLIDEKEFKKIKEFYKGQK